MKVTYKNKKVVIEMTVKQLIALKAVFGSFVDQVDASNRVYGDSVRSIDSLLKADYKAKGGGR